MGLRGENTRVIGAGGRRIIPGLNDSHFHLVRGARDYNLELRWDGVRSLQRGLVTGGDVVYSAAPYAAQAPEPLPPVSPAWSPVAAFGGYQR